MTLIIKQPTNGKLILKETYDPTPSLDLRFAETKSLRDYITDKNLVNHTRASSGTYVGSDGLIKTAVTNLLLQSEDFSTTWTIVRGTLTPNAITAPNGQNTANLYTADGTLLYHVVGQYGVISGAATRTYSVYAKAGTGSIIQLNITATADAFVNFDLSTQTYGTVSIGAAVVNPSIVSVGNGWFRCSFTATGNGDGFEFGPTATLADTRRQYNSISDSVYFWGAQLEQSDTVGEYVKTTSTINSAPRFDHDPTTGESLGLLVEESRTNLLTYSEDFSQADWAQNTNVTLTASDVAAPDGTFTATTASNPTTGLSRVGLTVTGTATTNYVGSIWARRRSGTGDTFLRVAENNPQAISLTTEWQRVWATDESTTTTIRFYIDFYDTGNAIDIWGAQLEEGSFPTSYIPTEGSTVTRAADVASISGSNFSSWYRQDEGTVFVDFDTANSNGARIFQVSDGTTGNRYDIFAATPGTLAAFMNTLSVSQLTGVNISGAVANNVFVSACFSYKTNDVIIAGDGILSSADNSCSIPTTSQLTIGSRGDGVAGVLDGHIRRLTYWPQRLPNDTLQTITQ